ncbi:MAG: fused MFS/spermidine synthase [Planctomycetes bacterium]|nr:fused MFS/spermidine synthase [Planctomycetota bacterium]
MQPQNLGSTGSPGGGRVRAAWVLLTLFLGGAVVMLLELLGTRIVHPWYGSGVYVWAALISVTLASLAAGTWAGGVAGDRWPREGTLYGAVLAAALFMAPAPFLAEPVMRRAFAWCGPAGGAFFSAACLFSLPLAFLGALAPVVLRLRSRGVASIGGTAGRLYAISTLGSLAGTLVVGFVLIPRFGNREVLLGASALLACVSAVGSLLSRAGGRSVACAAAVLLLPLPSLARVQGTDIVHSSQSLYGLVEVIDRDGIRYLMIDGNVHSHMNLGEGVPAITCEYVRTFGLLPAFRPERGRVLGDASRNG